MTVTARVPMIVVVIAVMIMVMMVPFIMVMIVAMVGVRMAVFLVMIVPVIVIMMMIMPTVMMVVVMCRMHLPPRAQEHPQGQTEDRSGGHELQIGLHFLGIPLVAELQRHRRQHPDEHRMGNRR